MERALTFLLGANTELTLYSFLTHETYVLGVCRPNNFNHKNLNSFSYM